LSEALNKLDLNTNLNKLYEKVVDPVI